MGGVEVWGCRQTERREKKIKTCSLGSLRGWGSSCARVWLWSRNCARIPVSFKCQSAADFTLRLRHKSLHRLLVKLKKIKIKPLSRGHHSVDYDTSHSDKFSSETCLITYQRLEQQTKFNSVFSMFQLNLRGSREVKRHKNSCHRQFPDVLWQLRREHKWKDEWKTGLRTPRTHWLLWIQSRREVHRWETLRAQMRCAQSSRQPIRGWRRRRFLLYLFLRVNDFTKWNRRVVKGSQRRGEQTVRTTGGNRRLDAKTMDPALDRCNGMRQKAAPNRLDNIPMEILRLYVYFCCVLTRLLGVAAWKSAGSRSCWSSRRAHSAEQELALELSLSPSLTLSHA